MPARNVRSSYESLLEETLAFYEVPAIGVPAKKAVASEVRLLDRETLLAEADITHPGSRLLIERGVIDPDFLETISDPAAFASGL